MLNLKKMTRLMIVLAMFSDLSNASFKHPHYVSIPLILQENMPPRCGACTFKVAKIRLLTKGKTRATKKVAVEDENTDRRNVQAEIPCEVDEI